MKIATADVGLRDDEGSKVTPEQKKELNAFVLSRSSQFAASGPATEFAIHRIKVNDNQEPIASPLCRMSPKKREPLKLELEKLLDADVIEECESPWAANWCS